MTLETKSQTTDVPKTPDLTKALDDFGRTWEAFKSKNDERLEQIEKGMGDVITQEELDKINEAIDKTRKTVDDLVSLVQRPANEESKEDDELDDMKMDGETDDEDMTQMSRRGHRGYNRRFRNRMLSRLARTPEMKAYRPAFEAYFRKGADVHGGKTIAELEQKALSVDSNPDGGYLVVPEMEQTIDRLLSQVSPIRQIATVRQISTSMYQKPFNKAGTGSGWVGEQGARPETTGPDISLLQYPVMELYAMPAATQSLLDDAFFNIEEWLAEEVNITFAEQEGAAFINGNGVTQPRGFLTETNVANSSWAWGKLGYTATGADGAFKTTAAGDDADNIIDLVYSLKSGYRQNSRFVMSRLTQGECRKMKDDNGVYIWQPGLVAGQPDMLAGYPVTEAEDMPEIASDSLSIAFGDFQRGYVVVDRMGIRVLRDPYSSKPYVLFYTTKRVGGGVQNFEAIKLLKFGTS